jgi:hypothetical protein
MKYALNPKNYTKYTKYIMQNKTKKKHRKKTTYQIFKLLNYKDLLTEKKVLILKKNQINFVKNQKK